MTVKRTRELLGKLVADMTDDQVQDLINSYIPVVDMLLRSLKQSKLTEKPKKVYNHT
jgi:hypothetical protein